eukprot:jgi/Phyca11/13892/fgenesh1_pg.PHYCAscaffold_5_\
MKRQAVVLKASMTKRPINVVKRIGGMRRQEPNANHLAMTDGDLVRDVKLLLKTLKEGHDNENEVTGNIGIMSDEIETHDTAKIHVDGDTENNGHNHDDLLRNQVLATEMTAPAMTR